MTPEQKAAFVNAQASLMQVELTGMVVANQKWTGRGLPPEYPESAFEALYAKYEGVLGHNAMLDFFEEG